MLMRMIHNSPSLSNLAINVSILCLRSYLLALIVSSLPVSSTDRRQCRQKKKKNQRVVDIGVAKFENCLTDIYTWMSQNKLKLNADKTEVLVMGTPQMRAKISILSITVNGVIHQFLMNRSVIWVLFCVRT